MATGDVSDSSAVVWVRTTRPVVVRIDYAPAGPDSSAGAGLAHRERGTVEGRTETSADLTLKLDLRGLRSGTRYRLQLSASGSDATAAAEFTTLPAPENTSPISFGWSGDLGGQGRCRTGADSYGIFSLIQDRAPDFFVFLGDTIYADDVCGLPNLPGSDFRAVTLEQFRAKQRYQRGSIPLQRFLASVPLFLTWDDHDVRNNFAGPFESYMPAGRQALFEYWPIRALPHAPYRLYRRVRAGADLELFFLDTRQYRSRNSEPDGPLKTMLGAEQLGWLTEGLRASTALWKVIVSSVPLSIPKPGTAQEPGYDGWAGGPDGTGFEQELKTIAQTIIEAPIRNVVWLTGDVHFVQGLAYDVDRDGLADFHEFTVGPLSAGTGRVTAVRSPFAVTTLISEGGYQSFGLVRVDRRTFVVKVIDGAGRERFTHRLTAQ
ncbi:MAG: alkaline phosphatase D family protein [Nitrospiraceae bacterium]